LKFHTLGQLTCGIKGQIVVLKEAREKLDINPGESLLNLVDYF